MAGESIESNFVSMRQAVEFIDVLDQYSYNENLQCTYKFNDYTPQEGDRVAIFKLGWNFVKDYVVFEWVPTGSNKDKEHVIFKKHVLPKNSEIYQICYISGENVLQGASSPFQFAAEVIPMTQSSMSIVSGEDVCDRTISDNQDELRKLKEENEMLRTSLKAVIFQKNGRGAKNYDSEISDLRKITDSLKEALAQQQKEINMLKVKITNGGEEYRKLYLEKVKVEKKYDKLRNKMEDTGKTVSEAVNFDIGDLKSIPPFPFSK
ncbi:calcium-binding and coiled-coil domain-containing protein 2 [Anoplophora glabripennis]|uniref:calcium-binding and coiled-coil domain-containing protein 2 n=1 Tax=Anoplophora glabripennis TaxID=217634 RepID=UPI000873E1D5|nr:calcium-binding and coiled-coil domain-containing protein 2 [Anoplophora glabripennis]